jgi:hypothetical protein
MNATEVDPILTFLFSILIFLLAMVGIGGIEFGPFN